MTSWLSSSLIPISRIHADQVHVGSVITVAGWVRTRRGAKKLSFLDVNDGSHPNGIQVIAEAGKLANYELDLPRIHTGASVRVTGALVESPGQGQRYELHATKLELIGVADPEQYPLQKKEMTFETLRELAHLRVRTATFSSMFRLRSLVCQSIHEFFADHGFFYVHTPIITANDAEGAGETFRVTTNDPYKVSAKANRPEDDFFGKGTMLCVTGQLEGELMAMGLGRVYTFGPTFRAENSNTSRHLAEFWMIEPEAAFVELQDNMSLAQELIRHVVGDVLEKGAADLDVLATKSEVNPRSYLEPVLTSQFVRVSYTEAVEILLKSGQAFEYPVSWGGDLKSEHERYLCEKHFKAPTIVYDYPAELKAFYMYLNDDGKTVRAMDVLMPGIGEVIGGSQREDREDVLRKRMEEKGIPAADLDWYLQTRRFGGVPHSGFGLGLERLMCWLTGFGNVRDVIPFPRTPRNCEF